MSVTCQRELIVTNTDGISSPNGISSADIFVYFIFTAEYIVFAVGGRYDTNEQEALSIF
jgi:hypothetical protein